MSLTTQAPPSPGPEANLGYLFRLAHQRFVAALEECVGDLGLSAQEYGILSVFETRRELSTSDLARIAQVTRQTMHAAILRLESAGLLERDAQNRRVVLLRPTKQGRATMKTATRRVRALERSAMTGLQRDEEQVVRGWLAQVAAGGTSEAASRGASGGGRA
ncbi:MAG TPA: MarR family transcriptional regulator [Solirubrobacteraceae bacterium]